jgi:hypothetical protein
MFVKQCVELTVTKVDGCSFRTRMAVVTATRQSATVVRFGTEKSLDMTTGENKNLPHPRSRERTSDHEQIDFITANPPCATQLEEFNVSAASHPSNSRKCARLSYPQRHSAIVLEEHDPEAASKRSLF